MQPEKWLSQLRGMAWSLHRALEETKTQPSVPKEWTQGLSSFQQSLPVLEVQPVALSSWTSEDFRERPCTVSGPIWKQRWAWKRQDSPCGNHFCGLQETEGLLSTQNIPLPFPVSKPQEHNWFGFGRHSSGREWLKDKTHPTVGSPSAVCGKRTYFTLRITSYPLCE